MSLKRVVLIAALVALVSPAVAFADGVTFVFWDGHMVAVQPATGGALGTTASNVASPARLTYVSHFLGSFIPGGSAGFIANNGNLPPQAPPTFGSLLATGANTFNFGSVYWVTGLATATFVGATSSSVTYDAAGSGILVTGNGGIPGTGAVLFSGNFVGPTTMQSISAPLNPNCTTCNFWYSLSGQVVGSLDPGLLAVLGLGNPANGSRGLFFSFIVGFNGVNDTNGNVEGGNISVIVPEPGTLALFGTGLISVAGFIRRRIKA